MKTMVTFQYENAILNSTKYFQLRLFLTRFIGLKDIVV